jgi:hypothetical protein
MDRDNFTFLIILWLVLGGKWGGRDSGYSGGDLNPRPPEYQTIMLYTLQQGLIWLLFIS